MTSFSEVLFRSTLFLTAGIFTLYCLSVRFQIRRALDVFVLLWGYYAFSVPFDLLLGNKLEGSFLLPNLGADAFRPLVIEAFFQMCALAAGTITFYRLRAFALSTSGVDSWHATPAWMEIRRLPPLTLFLGAYFSILVAYQLSFETSSRAEIDELARADPFSLLQSLVVDLGRALSIVLLLIVPQRRQAILVLCFGALFTLITGSRTLIAYFVLLYILRFQVRLSVRSKLLLLFGAALVLILTKPLFAALFSLIEDRGLEFDTDLETLTPSFSGFESIDVYSYYAYFRISEIDISPLRGYSYFILPVLRSAPGFLIGGSPSQTLAERYSVLLNPFYDEIPNGLAFSALGEAWLNFGFFGPALVGSVLGWVIAAVDSRRRGLFFALFVLLILRFFRSDMASLLKANLLVTGFLCIVCLAFLLVYSRCVEWLSKVKRSSLVLR